MPWNQEQCIQCCSRTCLHLCALVLEPKLDLQWLEAELPAQLLPLLVIWVWALLKEPDPWQFIKTLQTIIRHEPEKNAFQWCFKEEEFKSWFLRFHFLDLMLGVAVVPLLLVRPLVGVFLTVIARGAIGILAARLALKLICQCVGAAMDDVVAAVHCTGWDLIKELLLERLLQVMAV